MPLKDTLAKMCNDYFLIVTGVVFSIALFGTLFNSDAELDIADIWNILISGVVFTLPHFVFVSRTELNKRQWRIRIIPVAGDYRDR